jgi:hypothetical protein
MAKAGISIVKDHVGPALPRSYSENQFGGVAGGGTDFANHTVRTAIHYAKAFALSIFILFLDLEKAYDKVVRELMFGWPQGDASASTDATRRSKIEYLTSIGVEPSAAEFIVTFVQDHGTVLDTLNVDEKVQSLLNGLHSHAWFKYGNLESMIVSTKGGRQGCKLGGIIFNGIYERALAVVRGKLKDAGTILVLKLADGTPFWSSRTPEACETVDVDVIEVTFVDDEAAITMASSPVKLEKAISIVVDAFNRTFAEFGLTINWKKGKSEGMLRLRGKNATAKLDKLRSEGELRIPVDEHRNLHVVGFYKHLGGIIDINDCCTRECIARASSAMSAYSPIAAKIFGSSKVGVALKFIFLSSLVLSRLLFNIHTLVVSVSGLKRLNSPYMRVLRRIYGQPRFDDSCTDTDVEIRRSLSRPSIDCLVVRQRLRYLPRLLLRRPRALIAMLQATFKDDKLPWVVQLRKDFNVLYSYSWAITKYLPAPDPCESSWF